MKRRLECISVKHQKAFSLLHSPGHFKEIVQIWIRFSFLCGMINRMVVSRWKPANLH